MGPYLLPPIFYRDPLGMSLVIYRTPHRETVSVVLEPDIAIPLNKHTVIAALQASRFLNASEPRPMAWAEVWRAVGAGVAWIIATTRRQFSSPTFNCALPSHKQSLRLDILPLVAQYGCP